jgi:hypothetical protein
VPRPNRTTEGKTFHNTNATRCSPQWLVNNIQPLPPKKHTADPEHMECYPKVQAKKKHVAAEYYVSTQWPTAFKNIKAGLSP